MSNATKLVMLAVAVIIVALIIVAAFSLVNTGQGLMDTGKKQVTNSVNDYSEAAYTVYDNASVAGTQVISAIKNAWTSGKENTVSVIVCTKDGWTVHYDKSGINSKLLDKAHTTDSSTDGDVIAKTFPADCNAKQLINGKSNTEAGKLAVGGSVAKCTTAGVEPKEFGADGSQDLARRYAGVVSYDAVSGYKASTSTSDAGYITRNANFQGSISRDLNGSIRVITFVQQ